MALDLKEATETTAERVARLKNLKRQRDKLVAEITELEDQSVVTLRMPRAVHDHLRGKARESGLSLNSFCLRALGFDIQAKDSTPGH